MTTNMPIDTRLALMEQEVRSLRTRLQSAIHKQQRQGERITLLTPEGVENVASRLNTLAKRSAEVHAQQTVIEQVCLMLNHRADPDGLRIVSELCRRTVTDPAWFKGADCLTINAVIESIRSELND